MTIAFDLDAAMKSLGLKTKDIAKITCRDRRTVWRWRKTGQVPAYVIKALRLIYKI